MSKVFRFWPFYKPNHAKYRILQEVVKENNAELAKNFLNDAGYLDLNLNEDKSTPPLSIAASFGNAQMVELLCNLFFRNSFH